VADRTLGGLCDWVEATWQSHEEIPEPGAETIRADTIEVIMTYVISTPLE